MVSISALGDRKGSEGGRAAATHGVGCSEVDTDDWGVRAVRYRVSVVVPVVSCRPVLPVTSTWPPNARPVPQREGRAGHVVAPS